MKPDLIRHARRGREKAPLMVFLSGLGILILAPSSLGAVSGADDPACKVEKAVVILVEFPDVKNDVEASFARRRILEQLDVYVREMSCNKAGIGGDVTPRWYTLPHPISRYRISPRNLEVDKTRVRNLIQDSIDAADADVDFSRYSLTVLFMRAKREEYGMIGLCGHPGMLGWGSDTALKTKGGQAVPGGVAIFSYQAHLGTLFHDVAHIIGGVKDGRRAVPCLYDHDAQAKPGPVRKVFVEAATNMGFWDPMSCHYYKWEAGPPGISAWTRLRLGWMDPARVRTVKPGETVELVLGPLGEQKSEIRVIKVPLSEHTCYLIENRQPRGFDRNLPSGGVLIMHADDRIGECRQGRSPVRLMNADPGVPLLEGAAFDVGKKDAYIDETSNLEVRLLEKTGESYKIRIGPRRDRDDAPGGRK